MEIRKDFENVPNEEVVPIIEEWAKKYTMIDDLKKRLLEQVIEEIKGGTITAQEGLQKAKEVESMKQ